MSYFESIQFLHGLAGVLLGIVFISIFLNNS